MDLSLLQLRKIFLPIWVIFFSLSINAQYLSKDSLFQKGIPNTGKLFSEVLFDYYYKAHSDPLSRGIGVDQYSGVTANKSAFAFRRVYLGYDYNISKKFTTELLLAAEDELFITSVNGSTTYIGDLQPNNKYTFYIKEANIRWKEIWKGTDLVIGQVTTPAYSLLTQKIWKYRFLEKTIADIRKTPSFDMGITLQGKFDKTGDFGYNVMVGNGTGARPENDPYKWFYGDLYAKFFDKKIVVDVYADYTKIDWSPAFHHSRNMLKGMIAYNTPGLTIGIEAYNNFLKKDVIATSIIKNDTLNANASDISFYIHGDIIKNKLRFVLRYDEFNPDALYSNINYSKYNSLSPTYDPSNNERLFIAGLDVIVLPTLHFLPNVWFNEFRSKQGATNTNHDTVYRLTIAYNFGK